LRGFVACIYKRSFYVYLLPSLLQTVWFRWFGWCSSVEAKCEVAKQLF